MVEFEGCSTQAATFTQAEILHYDAKQDKH